MTIQRENVHRLMNARRSVSTSCDGLDCNNDLFGLAREIRNDGVTKDRIDYTRTPDGRLLGQRTPGGDEYYVLDHLGSVRDVTDDAGNVAQKYTYEPYGRISWQKSAGYDNTWRFAQGYFDTDISRYKLGVRYYGFNQPHFTQFDPMSGKITDPMSLNKHQYGNCNPAKDQASRVRECSAGSVMMCTLEVETSSCQIDDAYHSSDNGCDRGQRGENNHHYVPPGQHGLLKPIDLFLDVLQPFRQERLIDRCHFVEHCVVRKPLFDLRDSPL